jgi:hypothetical protein
MITCETQQRWGFLLSILNNRGFVSTPTVESARVVALREIDVSLRENKGKLDFSHRALEEISPAELEEYTTA